MHVQLKAPGDLAHACPCLVPEALCVSCLYHPTSPLAPAPVPRLRPTMCPDSAACWRMAFKGVTARRQACRRPPPARIVQAPSGGPLRRFDGRPPASGQASVQVPGVCPPPPPPGDPARTEGGPSLAPAGPGVHFAPAPAAERTGTAVVGGRGPPPEHMPRDLARWLNQGHPLHLEEATAETFRLGSGHVQCT